MIGSREIDAGSEVEIDLVETRMRATLDELPGEERGRETYSPDRRRRACPVSNAIASRDRDVTHPTRDARTARSTSAT